MRLVYIAGGILVAGAALAQQLAVPVTEQAGNGQAASCSGISEVYGLNPRGDGFLAVRSGPGTTYPQIGALHNGQWVVTFNGQGDWVGIAKHDGRVDQRNLCGNTGPARDITGPDVGWVHGKWLRHIAG